MLVWENKNNDQFYLKISLNSLKQRLNKSGLEDNKDLQLLWPYLAKRSSILEVGAGYGRVLQFLIDQNFKGEISAIERCDNFFAELNHVFSSSVNLYHTDLANFTSNKKFDCILWLWCGISDFNRNEQIHMLKKMCSYLSPQGILILDIVRFSKEKSSLYGERVISEEGVNLQRYLTSPKEISEFSQLAGLKVSKQINYQALNFKKETVFRALNILALK